MKPGDQILILTSKGIEELRNHAFQLDVSARNILSLIEQGCKTSDAILQRSMFPHNTVVDSLRRLLTNKFVAFTEDEAAPRAGNSSSARPGRRDLRLNFGIAPSQARFALSNFCMDEFGTDGQFLVDAVSLCTDIMSLQEVLNSIRSEVEESLPGRMPALIACIRELNDTDDASSTGSHQTEPAPAEIQRRSRPRSRWLRRLPPRQAAAIRCSGCGRSDALGRGDFPVSSPLHAVRILLESVRCAVSGICRRGQSLRGRRRSAKGPESDSHRDAQPPSRPLPLLAACVLREINETAL